MKLGSVIGRVTLSKVVPELVGARWLIVSPFTREHFQRGTEELPGMSKDPSLVVYDSLGGGIGQTIGFVEGACVGGARCTARRIQARVHWSERVERR
jgi:microcompartment protein CcmK/EutM